MASGQIFGLIPNPPGNKYAVEGTIASTGTATGGPFNIYPVWTFDAATQAFMDLYGNLSGYGGGGLTLTWSWMTTTTATTTLVWGAAFRDVGPTATISGSFNFDYNFATEPGSGNVAVPIKDSITFSDGADMDSLGDNEDFCLRIQRNATATGDAITVNAYFFQGTLILKET